MERTRDHQGARRLRRLALVLAGLVSSYVCLEGSAFLAREGLKLSVLGKRRDAQPLLAEEVEAVRALIGSDDTWYTRLDPDLGWSNGPGASHEGYSQNLQGLRSTRLYDEQPGARQRVAALGDSFVHADDVGDREAWTAVLEKLRPDLEVLNFGVSGYGIDQALLRYRRDATRFSPHVVLVGFISDDLDRHVNVFRPFLAPGTGQVLSKPRFLLENGQLRLVPNPFRDLDDYRRLLEDPSAVLRPLSTLDFFAPSTLRRGVNPWLPSIRLLQALRSIVEDPTTSDLIENGVLRTDTEAYALTVALFVAFREEVEHEGASFRAVLFPERRDFELVANENLASYAPLRRDLQRRGLDVIDMLAGFEAANAMEPEEVFDDVHYSVKGNRIVASYLSKVLDGRGEGPSTMK